MARVARTPNDTPDASAVAYANYAADLLAGGLSLNHTIRAMQVAVYAVGDCSDVHAELAARTEVAK